MESGVIMMMMLGSLFLRRRREREGREIKWDEKKEKKEMQFT